MKKLLGIITSILVIGGIVMLFSLNKQRTEQEQQYELEVQIAKLIVSDYEDVETIEFQGWGHSRETGMWGTTVVVNKSKEIGFSFSALSGLEEISTIITDETIERMKKEETKNKLRIMNRVEEINTTSLKSVSITYSKDRKK